MLRNSHKITIEISKMFVSNFLSGFSTLLAQNPKQDGMSGFPTPVKLNAPCYEQILKYYCAPSIATLKRWKVFYHILAHKH
jgi:hypothetical protein